MVRRAAISSNPLAIEWLKEAFQSRRPVVWGGNGLSYALGQGLSLICRQIGSPAFAVKTGEMESLRFALVGFISRSARDPGVSIDFLVTQEGNDIGWTGAPCLAVSDVDGGEDPWLALAYTREVLLSLARALGLMASDGGFPDHQLSFGRRHEVLVFERYVEPIQGLLQAVSYKIGDLPFFAIERGEIGHGFHARLWSHPDRYRLHCYLPRNSEAQWAILEQWAESAQIPMRKVFLREDLCEPSRVVESLCIVLKAVEDWMEACGKSPKEKPIPETLDQLRWYEEPICQPKQREGQSGRKRREVGPSSSQPSSPSES